MKYVFYVIVGLLLAKQSTAQFSFTYTQDSTVLSVLPAKGYHLTAAKPDAVIDLNGKWKYQQCDSVEITINGSLLTVGRGNRLTFQFKLGGNRYTTTIRNGNFTFTKKIARLQWLRKPFIQCAVPGLRQRKTAEAWLDSIDMSAVL